MTDELTGANNQLALFGKTFGQIKADWQKGYGLKSLSNVISADDMQQLKNYSKWLMDGTKSTEDFKDAMSYCSTSTQKLGNEILKLKTKVDNEEMTVEDATAEMNRMITAEETATGTTNALRSAFGKLALNLAISFAISGLITLFTEIAQAEQKAIDKANELSNAYKTQKETLSDLKKEYLDIVDSSDSETKKTKDLLEWKKKLVREYGYEKAAIEGVTTARATGLQFFDEEEQKTAQALINKTKNEYDKLYEQLYGSESGNRTTGIQAKLEEEDLDWLKEYEGIIAKIDGYTQNGRITGISFDFGDNAYEATENINKVLTSLNAIELRGGTLTRSQQLIKSVLEGYRDEYEKLKTDSETILAETGSALFTDYFSEFLKDDANKLDKVTADTFDDWKEKFNQYLEKNAKELLEDANFAQIAEEYFENLRLDLFPDDVIAQTNKYGYSLTSLSEKLETFSDITKDVSTKQSTIQSALEKVRAGTSLTSDEMQKLGDAYPDLLGKFEETVDGWTIGAEEIVNAYNSITQGAKNAINEQKKLLNDTIYEIQTKLHNLGKNAHISTSSDYNVWYEEYSQLNQDLLVAEEQVKAFDNLLKLLDIDNTSNIIERLNNKTKEYSDSISSLTSNMKSVSSAFEEQSKNGSLSVDTMLSLIKNGYATALEFDEITGAVKLNERAYIALAEAEIKEQMASLTTQMAEQRARQLEIINELTYHYIELSDEKRLALEAESEALNDSNSQLEQLYNTLEKVLVDFKDNPFSFGSDAEKQAFDDYMREYEKLHNRGLISDEEYYNQLETANELFYKNCTAHLSDYISNETQIFNARKDQYKKDTDEMASDLEDQYKRGIISAEKYAKALEELGISRYGGNSDGFSIYGADWANENLENILDKSKELKDEIFNELMSDLKTDGDKTFENILSDAQQLFDKNFELFSDDPKSLKTNAESIFNAISESAQDAVSKLLISPEEYLTVIDEWGKKLSLTENIILEAQKALSESDYLDSWDLLNNYGDEKSKDNYELRAKRIKYIYELAEKLYGKDGQNNLKAYNELIRQGLDDEQSLIEDYYDSEIEKIREIKDAIDEVADEEERRNKLIEARQKLENAKKQRNVLTFQDGTFFYDYNQDDVKSAEEELANAEKAILEQELENQISFLEEQKQNATDFYTNIEGTLFDSLSRIERIIAGDESVLNEINSEGAALDNDVKPLFDISKAFSNGFDLSSLVSALGGNPTADGIKNFIDGFNATLVGKQITPSSIAGAITNNSNTTNNATKVINVGGITVKVELTLSSIEDFVEEKIDEFATDVANGIAQQLPRALV